MNIAAEISKQVDECPSNGYLLDSSIQVPTRFVLFSPATAATWSTYCFPCVTVSGSRSHARQVSCHASSVAALLQQDKVSVADVLTLNKAGSFSCEKLKGRKFFPSFASEQLRASFWKFSL